MPTKDHWKNPSSLDLIEKSCNEIKNLWERDDLKHYNLYLPKLGCRNGGLTWEQVEPIMDKYLTDERFTVVDLC